MAFQEFDEKQEPLNPFQMIDNGWFLLTAGNQEKFNTMTCSWGFMGIIWNKPTLITVVRPQRYTKEFLDQSALFTISFYGPEQKKALGYCGAHSGRDVDKILQTGLTPVFADDVVYFEQAQYVFVCKKVYSQAIQEANFLVPEPLEYYPNKDYHTAYYGEIVKAYKKV